MSKIKTAGQLREFLLDTMEQVRDAKVSVERAQVVVKTAAQVNESIYAELKSKQLSKQLGEASHAVGSMPLGAEAA